LFFRKSFWHINFNNKIGDRKMKNYGVISNPSIYSNEINENEDQYIIIVINGVWPIPNPHLILVI